MLFSTDMFYVTFNAHVDIAQPAVYTKKSLELDFFLLLMAIKSLIFTLQRSLFLDGTLIRTS